MKIYFTKKIAIMAYLLSFCLSMSQSLNSLTAKEIIDKNIKVTGGLTHWKSLNSILLQGKVILGVKEEYPVKIYQSRPNFTKTLVVVNKKEQVIEGYDGKKGYAMNYATNRLQEYADYKPESFDTDFIDYEQKGFEAKVIGEEKIGDKYVYKVELIKNVNKTIYYFDKQTFYLLQEEKKGEIIRYFDYKKVGSLLMPFRLESTSIKKDSDYVMIFNKIEVNKVFKEDTFKFK